MHKITQNHCFAFLCCLLLVAAGCPQQQKTASAETPARPAVVKGVPVSVAMVVQKNMPVEVRTVGTVEAYATVTIKPYLTAELKKVHFQEGQLVNKDDVLFNLDERQASIALHQAQANLAKDTVQMRNAQQEADRKDSLWRKGSESLENKNSSRASAEALESLVRADAAAVAAAQLQLSYCTIPSPVAGRTGRLLVQPGNLVKANDTDLVLIKQIRPIYVAFAVPEQQLSALQNYAAKSKLEVQAIVPGEDNYSETGKLSFSDNTVDRTTGTILVKATFDNKQEKLWPGQFVYAVLTLTTQPNAIVIPSQAVQVGQLGSFVFVVKADQTVEVRPVVVSRQMQGEVVIAKGLQPQEIVVTDGQLRLTPGAKVEIKSDKSGEKGA